MQNSVRKMFPLPSPCCSHSVVPLSPGITRTSSFRWMGNMPPPVLVSKCRCSVGRWNGRSKAV